jgi:oligopeptide transport system permease protein
MIQDGFNLIFSKPYMLLFPAIALALLMLAFTFLGDGLRDALDPKMRR